MKLDDGSKFCFGAQGDGDVCEAMPALSDELLSHAAQHDPLQPSLDAPEHFQSTFYSSEGHGDAQQPANSMWCDDSPPCSLRPERAQSKLARVREKNRRAQKAYRQRLKEEREVLEAAIVATTQNLEATRERWRDLRLHRSSLQEQLAVAHRHPSTLSTISQTSGSAVVEVPAAVEAVNDAPVTRQLGIENLRIRSTLLVPRTPSRSPFEFFFSGFSGHDRSFASNGQSRDPPRPISSFKRFESISFSALRAFMAPRGAPNQTFKYNVMAQAVTAYQHSVSERSGVAVSDICWIQQWNFPGLEPELSLAAGADSPECIVCATLCYTLGCLESLFLVVEHETLVEASESSYVPPEHPSFLVSAPRSTPPEPPDPGILSRAYLRCGLDQMMPLKVVLQRTVKPLFEKYRASLPQRRWRAVCMQGMRISQAVIDAYGGPTEASEQLPGHSSGGEETVAAGTRAGQGVAWEDLSAALLATNQHVLCSLYEALEDSTKESTNKYCVRSKEGILEAQGRSLAQVEQRMYEVIWNSCLSVMLFFQVSPIASRQMTVTQFLGQSQNIVRASRQSMKLYKQLQLKPDQRACMSERWRSWCRRRAALGHQLAAALARFHDACPQQINFARALMQCASLVVTAGRSDPPVDTGSDKHAASSPVGLCASVPDASLAMHASRELHRTADNGSSAASVNFLTRTWMGYPDTAPLLSPDDALIPAACSRDGLVQLNYRLIVGALEVSAPDYNCTEPSNASAIASTAPVGGNVPAHQLQYDLHASECTHDGHACTEETGMHDSSGDLHSVSINIHRQRSEGISGFSGDLKGATADCKRGAALHCEHDTITNSTVLNSLHPSQFARVVTSTRAQFARAEDSHTAPHEEDTPVAHAAHPLGASVTSNDTDSAPERRLRSAMGESNACQSCITCSAPAGNSDGVKDMNVHEGNNAWAPCMVCGEGRRALLLGESGEVAKAAYDALGSVLDVHTSDALMHFEFLGPFRELTEKQEALLLACAIDIGQPRRDMTALWQIAAEEERRETLFGHLTNLSI